MAYTTITTEGGLIPADILDALAAAELPGQRPEDFGLERTRNLSDRISAWGERRGRPEGGRASRLVRTLSICSGGLASSSPARCEIA